MPKTLQGTKMGEPDRLRFFHAFRDCEMSPTRICTICPGNNVAYSARLFTAKESRTKSCFSCCCSDDGSGSTANNGQVVTADLATRNWAGANEHVTPTDANESSTDNFIASNCCQFSLPAAYPALSTIMKSRVPLTLLTPASCPDGDHRTEQNGGGEPSLFDGSDLKPVMSVPLKLVHTSS
jgi:hypothetical protein